MDEIRDADFPSLLSDASLKALASADVWQVLIVDDDDEVHQATVLALAGTPVHERPLRFLHAFDTAQAVDLLSTHGDVAVVLLDTAIDGHGRNAKGDGGIALARVIRNELGLHDLRIVLRTDDAGCTPAIDAIRDYDINDFKTRGELSRGGLYATLTSAIRCYAQIHAFNVGRRGLDLIIKASGRMLTLPRRRDFARAIVSEIAGLLDLAPQGFVCTRDSVDGTMRVIAAGGRFTPLLEHAPDALGNAALTAALAQAFDERHNVFAETSCILFFAGDAGNDLTAYIDTLRPLDEINRRLLEVFAANIAINLSNVELFEQLHDQAYLDPLLHIANRLAFMQAVGTALVARPAASTVAIVDIDHFSHLNDALGYRYGDALLKAVAQRLIDGLPPTALVARLSSDTFGVLGDDPVVTPESLLPLFADVFSVEGSEQRLSVTIGLARLAEVEGNASEAIKSANIALNIAKHQRRGEGIYFVRRMEQETRARMRLLRELRAAFEQGQLQVEYQPQLCLRTHRLTGVEALLRWRDDAGHLIPPDHYIGLAESSGLIVALGKWVLHTACTDLRSLLADGADLSMSVNVSVVQFRHPGFLESVEDVLRDSAIDPRRLELEITESVAMLDASFMVGTLNRLKKRGISIAIDDFGTGFSSLSYLERLNVDRLKIDQSFVNQMMLSDSSLRIVETIVQFGRSLQLQVIAEGVEESAQAEALRRIGCHIGQGYLFGRPMTLAQLRERLAATAQDAGCGRRPLTTPSHDEVAS